MTVGLFLRVRGILPSDTRKSQQQYTHAYRMQCNAGFPLIPQKGQ